MVLRSPARARQGVDIVRRLVSNEGLASSSQLRGRRRHFLLPVNLVDISCLPKAFSAIVTNIQGASGSASLAGRVLAGRKDVQLLQLFWHQERCRTMVEVPRPCRFRAGLRQNRCSRYLQIS